MDCNVANLLLYNQIKKAGSPPFLGHLNIQTADKEKAIHACREFLDGDTNRISSIFHRFSYLAGWAVAYGLNEDYGKDGQKVYPIISNTIGVSLNSQKDRDILKNSYKKLYNKLGFPSHDIERSIYLYLVQAGVSIAQLHHIVNAFMHQREVAGDPPEGSTVLLNIWENESLRYVREGVVIPQRVVLWDDIAWHASLYARIASDPRAFNPETPYEEEFLSCYQRARKRSIRSPAHKNVFQNPVLLWGSDGVVLRLPRAEDRISVWFDNFDRPMRLKGGEERILRQPWPQSIRWEIDGRKDGVKFLDGKNKIVIFDNVTGKLLEDRCIANMSALEVDALDAVIVSRSPFDVDGFHAESISDDCFIIGVRLTAISQRLTLGECNVDLYTKPKRTVVLSGQEIATGVSGKLYGPDATILINTGLGINEDRKALVKCGEKSRSVNISIVNGVGSELLKEVLPEGISADPQSFCIELMAPSAVGSDEVWTADIKETAYVWPGFLLSEGRSIVSQAAPKNFREDLSAHIESCPDGLLFVSAEGCEYATAAFDIGEIGVAFRFRWPDVVMHRHRPDGSKSLLPIGARISVGPQESYDQISIRSHDSDATLNVGKRFEKKPFAQGMTRTIAISDLMEQGAHPSVVMGRSNGNHVVLLEIVDALEPEDFAIRPGQKGLRVFLSLGIAVDAIGIECESELGERAPHEVSLGRWPTSGPAPDWLEARLSNGDPRKVELSIKQRDTNGLSVGRVLIRPADSSTERRWRPLRNPRGDIFAIPLTAPHLLENVPLNHIKTRFETLSRWMSYCYDRSCWEDHGLRKTLPARWQSVGKVVSDMDLGAGALVSASLAPLPDEVSPSWIPLVHPVEIDPDIYSGNSITFLPVADLQDPGLAAGARMVSLSSEKLQEGFLHGQALVAFSNYSDAEARGDELAGFSPSKFLNHNLFKSLDLDPSAGSFWHGTPLLGPGHLRAACSIYQGRAEAASVFVEGAPENRYRSDSLLNLVRHVGTNTEGRPQPPMPKRDPEHEMPLQTDLWVASTLSEFACASRKGTARAFVENLARGLARPQDDVLKSLGFLLHLAPELFFYFLLVWELARVRPR